MTLLAGLPEPVQFLAYALLAVIALVIVVPSLLAIPAFGPLWTIRPRACLYWVLFAAPTSAAMKVLAVLLSPLLSLVSLATGPVLPWPLRYFHTHDADLDSGQVQAGYAAYSNAFDKWLGRMAWICRNPAYTYMNNVVGHRADGVEFNMPGLNWDSKAENSTGFTRSYDKSSVSARGIYGPFYIWFGWKLVRARPDVLGEKVVMLAIGFNLAR